MFNSRYYMSFFPRLQAKTLKLLTTQMMLLANISQIKGQVQQLLKASRMHLVSYNLVSYIFTS